MSADQTDGPRASPAFIGFYAYADDTLRYPPEEVEPARWQPRDDRPSPRLRRRSGVGGGAALLALALVVGGVAWSWTPLSRQAPSAANLALRPRLQVEPPPEA